MNKSRKAKYETTTNKNLETTLPPRQPSIRSSSSSSSNSAPTRCSSTSIKLPHPRKPSLPQAPNTSSRRSSLPTSTSQSRKPTPPRPDWIAPPGKPCNSPTRIPAPARVVSSRKAKGRGVAAGSSLMTGANGSGVEVSPPTGLGAWGNVGSSPVTPSPLQRVDGSDVSSRVSLAESLSRRISTASSTIPESKHGISSPRGLGIHNMPSSSPPQQQSPLPTPKLPSTFSPFTNNPSTFSPFTPQVPKLLRRLSPTRIPNSPSTLHPFISKTHISPSCTSGCLTHRLVCGHLIVTERHEVCAENCEERKIGFKEARLKALGFGSCARDLDGCWRCDVCVEMEERVGEGADGGEVGEGRMVGKGVGKPCFAVLRAEFLDQGDGVEMVAHDLAFVQRKDEFEQQRDKSAHRLAVLRDRCGRKLELKPMVELLVQPKEGRFKRLTDKNGRVETDCR